MAGLRSSRVLSFGSVTTEDRGDNILDDNEAEQGVILGMGLADYWGCLFIMDCASDTIAAGEERVPDVGSDEAVRSSDANQRLGCTIRIVCWSHGDLGLRMRRREPMRAIYLSSSALIGRLLRFQGEDMILASPMDELAGSLHL